jgi:predicted transcriptional regulator
MRQSMTIRLDKDVLIGAKQVAEANNRTLTNYIETLIKKDISSKMTGTSHNRKDVDDPLIDELMKAYSAGAMTHRELEEQTGLWFGDVLGELGKRGLPLPKTDSTVHYNEKQMALYESIFRAQKP